MPLVETETKTKTETHLKHLLRTQIMNVIMMDGFAFRIPGMPSRYRASCGKDFGCFVTGDTKGMNVSKAEKAGLTRGDFVEMAVCAIDSKTLTFEPHYINEQFTEVWGIPVAGEMKTFFHEKCSELSTFLIHRQSQDRMKGLIEVFSRSAFNSWVEEGMQGDHNEYARSKASEAYFSNIFRFQLTLTEGKHGPFHYVATTLRPPSCALDEAALKVVRQIYEMKQSGIDYCSDPRLVENQQMCLGGATVPVADLAVPVAETKQLKGK